MRKKRRRGIGYWCFVRIPFWFIVLSLVWVTLLKWVPVRVTPLMIRRSVEYAKADGFHTRQHWKPLEEIEKMWKAHTERGKRIRGCSTISQQTAKNVFTWGSSTWARKIFEAYFTFLIEKIWGKERIMEVYLNVAEMGPGIYGAESAALHYFGCHASGLSRSQAVAIAVCLPNPLRYSPVAPGPYMTRRQAQIRALIPKVRYPDWVR